MNKFSKLALAAAAAVSINTGAHAGIVIDDFSTSQALLTDLTTDNSGFWSQVAGGMIGGFRDLFITKTGNVVDDGVLGAKIRAASGKLSFSSDDDNSGVAIVRWDGATAGTGATINGAIGSINATGLGAQNLTAGGGAGFSITVTTADLNFPFTLQAFTNAGNWSELSVMSTGVGVYFIPFAAFVAQAGAGANFGSIGALQAIVNYPGVPVNAVDFSIDIVQVPMPEPGSLALVGLAMLGVGAARRYVKGAAK